MKVFHRKAFKDFKKFGWRSVLIILILALSVGGSLGFIYVLLAGDPWIEAYYDNVNHADYVYQLENSAWINQSELDGLNDLEEVKDYTGRLFWKSAMKLEGQNEVKYILLVGLEPSKPQPNVFNYTLSSGKHFTSDGNNLSIVIDTDFAQRNNMEIGDMLNLGGLNNAKLNISGFCNSPEFLMMTSNPEYSIPIKGSISVGYLSKDVLKYYIIQYFKALNSSSQEDLSYMIYYYDSIDYNNIAVTFGENFNSTISNNAVKTYLEGTLSLNIEVVESFAETGSYNRFHGNIQDAKKFTTIILIFMLLMGLFITYVIFGRYVFNQKQQIGILITFGYRKHDINKYFLNIFLLITLITIPLSLLIGYSVGWAILGIIVSNTANLSLNNITFMFLPEIIYIGLGIGLFIIFVSIYFPVINVKRKNVADLVYGQSESKIFVLRFRKSLKPKKRISHNLIHRNLFRHKKRLLFTTIAMTFSLLIISATQTIIDSMNYNVARVFKSDTSNIQTNENWDLNVDFQNSVNMSYMNNTVDQIFNIDGVNETQIYVKGLVTAKGKEDQVFLLIGFDAENSKMHHFTWNGDPAKNSIPLLANEIVISRQHSVELNKKIGDNLTIVNPSDENFTMKIVGIHKELMSTGYVALNGGRSLLHDNDEFVDGIYVLLEPSANKDIIVENLYGLDNIEIILDSKVMSGKLAEFFNDFVPLMFIVVIYGLIVSFFIIFYNSIMNIYDKNYEFGILRSLGYGKLRILGLILGENTIQGLISIILALIFTYPLSLPLAAIFQGNGSFEVVVGQNAIIYVVIPPIILIILGSIVSLRTIYKTNLYEQVQTRFIG
ncbi:hypothetical protein LCGC14_0500730 [marine sediment metagenome]|uniref:ABC3 transporter permease C-terminal domain-containing protein n=1 Tax=marine sediment metagenome TaxID=412755 RepID=A0A0F9S923_9ZZZZ|nr:MAG: FtsX-like permease family protein [Candidatus Lokiarchaeum sp. GC14_75]